MTLDNGTDGQTDRQSATQYAAPHREEGRIKTYTETLHLTTEVDARRHLRSASTSTLTVPSTRWSTIGDRAFPVAAACAWNSLPSSVGTVSSLNGFRDDLKTVLFRASFDDRTGLLPFSLTTDTRDL